MLEVQRRGRVVSKTRNVKRAGMRAALAAGRPVVNICRIIRGAISHARLGCGSGNRHRRIHYLLWDSATRWVREQRQRRQYDHCQGEWIDDRTAVLFRGEGIQRPAGLESPLSSEVNSIVRVAPIVFRRL